VQVNRVLKILEDPELKKESRIRDRRAAIRQVANDIFDFTEITRRSLGRHWQARTPQEQEEFVGLFGGLLEQSYISKIETYSGEKIAFLGDSTDGDVAVVRTRVISKQGTEIPIDYRMRGANGRWLTYDVSIEGISLIGNYRTQFDRVIQKSSYQELAKTLRAKQDERLAADGRRRDRRPDAPAVEAADAARSRRTQSP
jgi:phospholipid transport system substrate-binding protein